MASAKSGRDAGSAEIKRGCRRVPVTDAEAAGTVDYILGFRCPTRFANSNQQKLKSPAIPS